MSCVIWKYPLFYLSGNDATRQQSVLASRDSRIIHVAIWEAEYPSGISSERVICAWVETDPAAVQYERKFDLLFTGHAIPFPALHRATIPDHDTGLVWHLYERLQ